jgi:rod shape-determining protein MreB
MEVGMFVPATVVAGQPHTSGPLAGPPIEDRLDAPAQPTAIAVDLGSGRTQVWVAGRGSVSRPTGDTFGTAGPLVRRGRVVDGSGCIVVLSQLIRRYKDPIPPDSVVVVCRPVLATMAEQDAIRRVVAAVFAPARVLFIDTVRAAAIGAGAAAGTLLIADIGAELTEVAVLDHGRVHAARRADVGTRDLARGAPTDLVAHATTRMINELRHDPTARAVIPAALTRGLVVVGDGAMKPDLTLQIATTLRIRARSAASPRAAALTGAGLAAMAAARHPPLHDRRGSRATPAPTSQRRKETT